MKHTHLLLWVLQRVRTEDQII